MNMALVPECDTFGPMPKEYVTMNLRLPPELHAALKKVADKEGRSLNNLIVYLLRKAVGLA